MRLERRESIVGALAIGGLALLAVAFLWEVAFLAGIPIARDMQLFFIPQKRLLWEALQAGRLPLWTQYLGTGLPLLANFQSGVFYPPNWLYAVAPFFESFNGLLVFHFLLGGVFTFLFCRAIRFSRASSWAAATVYMLGGYYVSLTNLINVLQVAAWAPALSWILVVHLRSRTPLSLAGLVAIYWLAFLAGEPLTFALAAGTAACFAVVWWRHARPELHRGRALVYLVGSLGLAALFVAGLAAVQILPTAEYIAESDRAGALPFEEASRYALEPVRLLNLVVPADYRDPEYAFGQKAMLVSEQPWLFSVYLGVVALLLAIAAARNEERRGEVIFWSVAGLIGLLLALGDATPIFGWLYAYLPGFGSFRFPERFLFLTAFAVAMLAGYGLSALRANRRPFRLDAALGLGALLLLLIARVVWAVYREPILALGREHYPMAPLFQNFEFGHALWAANLDRILVLLAAALVLVALHRRQLLRESVLVTGLLGLVALDFWIAHRHLTPVVDRAFYERPPMVAEVFPLEQTHLEYRYQSSPFDEDITRFHTLPGLSLESQKWMWQQTIQPNLGVLYAMLTQDSGDAIHLEKEVERSVFLALLPDADRWRLLQLSSVRYVYSFLNFDRELWEGRVLLDSLPGYIYEVRNPLPRAFVADSAYFAPSELEALNRTLERDFDPRVHVALYGAEAVRQGAVTSAGFTSGTRREAVTGRTGVDRVSRAPRGTKEAESASSTARITSDSGSELTVEVRAQRPGWLVLTDAQYPGWSAFVDGERRPVLQANYFYRAVSVAPGDRQVTFVYRSAPLERGRWISAVTLLVGLLLLGGYGVAKSVDLRRARSG